MALQKIDGTDRLLAFRLLKGWPLIVVYAVNSDAVLRDWYLHMGLLGFSTILLTLALVRAERLMLQKATDEQEGLRRLIEETSRRQDAEAALQQAQKLEALGRLTGGVAHDFNNLLAAILGSLELLRRHVSGDRAVRLLGTATQAAERGARLTAQMLAFARRKELTIRPVDVAATIGGMHDLLQRACGPDIAITYDLADALAPALADVGQLEMALLNLTVNARDAMPKGGTLTIKAHGVKSRSAG